MSANLSWNSPAPLWLRTGAGALVVALHIAILAAILLTASKVEPAPKPVVVSVRFVQIAPTEQQAPTPPEPPKPTPPKPVPPKAQPLPPKPAPAPPRDPLPVSDTALSTPPPPVQAPAPVAESAPPAPAPEKPAPAPVATAPVSSAPRQIGQVEYVRKPEPVYPRMSQRMGEQGTVIVRVVINTDGTAGNVTVEKTSGYDRLDDAALNAVKRSLFKPPSENGVPFIGVARVPITFST